MDFTPMLFRSFTIWTFFSRVWTGLVVKQMVPEAWPPCLTVSSMATSRLRASFRASKIRMMSMPFLMEYSTNLRTTSSG